MKALQIGQASIEYAVCAGLLAAALLLPVIDGQSVATRVVAALAQAYHSFAALIAIA